MEIRMKKTLQAYIISVTSFLLLFTIKVLPVFATALENPLTTNDPRVIIGYIINAILGIVGSLALLMFIYGGVIWLISQGNEQKVEQGKKLIVWSAMGLIVIFTSYALVIFVLRAVRAPGSTGQTTDASAGVDTD
ncbi:pilin [Patescibacteria group bacterium]|nr:pilin [Patescibacteria group bacterium]